MAEVSKNRPHWVYVTLISIAIVAVIILAVTVFSMKQQIDAFNQMIAVAAKVEPADSGRGEKAPSSTADPSASSKDPLAPADEWLLSPFDPAQWTPFKELYSMQDQINRMFDNAFSHFNQSPDYKALTGGIAFTPEIDVLEGKDKVTIKVDVPGVKAGDVDVEVKDQKAIITGERVENDKATDAEGNVVRRERRVGRFTRVVELPAPVVADKMKAKCEAGTYTITLPKAS